MVTIEICIGSSCFVKGSNEVVELLKNYIAEHHLEEKVQLKGAFCMGQCTKGLGIKVNGKILEGATLYNVVDLLEPELRELL